MDKIRILFVIASSDIGGAENFVYTLLKLLDDTKFEKYVVCPDGGYYAEKFANLSKGALFINSKRSFMNIATIWKVARFVKENKINIIHSMLYTSDFCGIVAHLLNREVRAVNTINGFNFLIFDNDRLYLKRRIGSFFYRLIYRFSDKVVTVSRSVQEDFMKRPGIKSGSKAIETVLAAGTYISDNDISGESITKSRFNFLADKDIVLLAIGTLNKIKDYDTMIAAFYIAARGRSDIKLLIAGNGPEKVRLEKKVSALGLSGKISFLGALEERRKNTVLNLADIFVISSISEGCPTVVLEAMHFGKPIVATSVGGIPEILTDNETGMLVPAQDPTQLASSLLNLTEDSEKRLHIGQAAKALFEKRFTYKHMVESYSAIYQDLLNLN